jgi:hypothetical protein
MKEEAWQRLPWAHLVHWVTVTATAPTGLQDHESGGIIATHLASCQESGSSLRARHPLVGTDLVDLFSCACLSNKHGGTRRVGDLAGWRSSSTSLSVISAALG